MKKNLLLYGVFLCALSMSSCSGGSKSSHVMDSSSMSVENANEVMKYYDTSLKILKDLVNENEIKAVTNNHGGIIWATWIRRCR